jgi:hypothetical protein
MNTAESFLEQLSASLNSSSSSSSQSSSSSSSYAGSTGSGGSSRSSATSPSGETSNSEQSTFVPGATSTSASASATASDQGATTSATVSVPAEGQEGAAASPDESNSPDADEETDIGSSANTTDTDSQATGIVSLSLLIGAPEGGLLATTPQQDIFWGGSGANIFLISATGVTDLSQADIILDFSPTDGDFLALSGGITLDNLVFEVIDFSGDGRSDSTVLRSSIDNRILGVVINSVDDFGASLISHADFIEPTLAEAATPPAPELQTEILSTVDILIGTSEQGTLVGGDHPALLVGHDGADLFVLSAKGHRSVEMADIILGFSPEQGDQIHVPESLLLSDIILELRTTPQNNGLSHVAITSALTGDFHAVIFDTCLSDVAAGLGISPVIE